MGESYRTQAKRSNGGEKRLRTGIPGGIARKKRTGQHLGLFRRKTTLGTVCNEPRISDAVDQTIVVTQYGRICLGRKKINFSQVFAGQAAGIEVHDDIWLVTFMDHDLGYFDLETRMLEPLDNPFGPRLSPM